MKPMKILDFPARRRAGPAVRERIASVESLLGDCLGRQAELQQDGRRLQASLDRLSLLTRDMVRSAERLRHTLGRLRACHPWFGPPPASS
ncbi:MAG: hypothetical protein HYS34_00705 [Acidobacteria bacterium]|nr:hypothetical protein [Acidobacteriota bacterium]